MPSTGCPAAAAFIALTASSGVDICPAARAQSLHVRSQKSAPKTRNRASIEKIDMATRMNAVEASSSELNPAMFLFTGDVRRRPRPLALIDFLLVSMSIIVVQSRAFLHVQIISPDTFSYWACDETVRSSGLDIPGML